MARIAGGRASASAGRSYRATVRAEASRFEEGSEWARAERADRWRAILVTVVVHGVLAVVLGISIPAATSRAEASGQSYQDFEVQIPEEDRLRRLLSPEPTRAATRMLSPSMTLAARPIEGARSYDLGQVLPSRPAVVTTPQAGRFGATGGLLEQGGEARLLSMQIEDSRRDAPDVLRTSAELSGLIERRASEAIGAPGEPSAAGVLELDGSTANVVTLYREEVSISEQMLNFGISGSCQVEMRVDPSGRVAEATVLTSSGSSLLDAAALEAARRWRYDPRALERLRVNRCGYWFRALPPQRSESSRP